jgi:hypothetical protein
MLTMPADSECPSVQVGVIKVFSAEWSLGSPETSMLGESEIESIESETKP